MENKALELLDAPTEVLVPCPWQLLKREAAAGLSLGLVPKFRIGMRVCAGPTAAQIPGMGWAGTPGSPLRAPGSHQDVSFV